MQQTFVLGTIIFGLVFLIAVFAEFWLTLFFGPEYVQFALILRIFSLSYIAIFIRDLWMIHLRTTHHSRIIFLAFATSSAFAISLAWPVMTHWGITGAALLLLVSHVISMLIVLYFVFRHTRQHGHEMTELVQKPLVDD